MKMANVGSDDYQSTNSDCKNPPLMQKETNNSHSADICESGCLTSTSVSSPRIVHNPFAAKVGTTARSIADTTDNKVCKDSRRILAPPTLVLNKCSEEHDNQPSSLSSAFQLRPQTVNNPFLRLESQHGSDCPVFSRSVISQDKSPHNDELGREMSTRDGSEFRTDNSAVCSSASVNSDIVSVTSFCYDDANNRKHLDSTMEASFVFGQNMNERVMNVRSDCGQTNGTAELYFCAALGDSSAMQSAGNSNHCESKRVKSLSESALEYESRKVKRTYEEVTVVTGEEDESNVLQVNCKLFTFDKPTSTWTERGRGLLRLNDKETDNGVIRSRIVARIQGSLRVVLNTQVWSGMSVDRPSSNSVRLTAMDGETVKVFLIKARPKDCDRLFGALDWRVTTCKSAEERRSNDSSVSISGGCHYSDEATMAAISEDDSTSSTKTLSTSPSFANSEEESSFRQSLDDCSKKRRLSPVSTVNDDDDDDLQERRSETIETKILSSKGLTFAASSAT